MSSPSLTTAQTTTTNLQTEIQHRAAWKAGLIGGLNVAALILSARFILMASVLGAIGLTWLAIAAENPMRLGAVALYTVTVVLPLVWLAGRR